MTTWSLKEFCLAVALEAYWYDCAPWVRRAMALTALEDMVRSIDKLTRDYIYADFA